MRKFILTACRRDPAERYQNISQGLEDLQPLTRLVPRRYHPKPVKQKMTTLFLNYDDEHEEALNRLMEEFRVKVNELGASLKTDNFLDITDRYET